MPQHNSMDISELNGQTITKILKDDITIVMYCKSGRIFSLMHKQSCCENVWIDDVIGELSDLISLPLVMAEESSDLKNWPRWTFYRLATERGYVTIRFAGTSNGYYSEQAGLYETYDWHVEYEKYFSKDEDAQLFKNGFEYIWDIFDVEEKSDVNWSEWEVITCGT